MSQLKDQKNGFKTIICGNLCYWEIQGTIRIENINKKNIYELNLLRTYDENIKIESKKYTIDELSYLLESNSKKS